MRLAAFRGFNPQTGSSAFQPGKQVGIAAHERSFNPQTGSSAFQPIGGGVLIERPERVSIPKRVHRPFSRSWCTLARIS